MFHSSGCIGQQARYRFGQDDRVPPPFAWMVCGDAVYCSPEPPSFPHRPPAARDVPRWQPATLWRQTQKHRPTRAITWQQVGGSVSSAVTLLRASTTTRKGKSMLRLSAMHRLQSERGNHITSRTWCQIALRAPGGLSLHDGQRSPTGSREPARAPSTGTLHFQRCNAPTA